MTVQRAIDRASAEPAYKARLLSDPHAALADIGVDLPSGLTTKVVENTPAVRHLVLPVRPSGADTMTLEELEAIAGGGKIVGIDLGTNNTG